MARSSSSLMRDRRGRFVSPAKAKAAAARRRAKSRSKSSSVSRKWRRSHPRDKSGRFVSPTKVRAARRRKTSRKSKSRSRSSSRLSAKEEKTLARRLGISVKQLREWTNAKSRRSLSDSIAKRDRRSRKAYARSKARTGEPEFKRVLDHFMDVLPEQVWCPRRMCGSVYEKHRELGILPKSVADLELIFSIPSEQKGVNARCWICLYRAYRDLYKNLNGVYPGPDVSDDLADRFSTGVAGTLRRAAEKVVDVVESPVETVSQLLALPSPESSLSDELDFTPSTDEVDVLKDYIEKLEFFCDALVKAGDKKDDEMVRNFQFRLQRLARKILQDYPALQSAFKKAEAAKTASEFTEACSGSIELLKGRLAKLEQERDETSFSF